MDSKEHLFFKPCYDPFINNVMYENEELKKEIKELKKENQELKKEIKELKNMISYQPGGTGYLEAKKDFEELADGN